MRDFSPGQRLSSLSKGAGVTGLVLKPQSEALGLGSFGGCDWKQLGDSFLEPEALYLGRVKAGDLRELGGLFPGLKLRPKAFCLSRGQASEMRQLEGPCPGLKL